MRPVVLGHSAGIADRAGPEAAAVAERMFGGDFSPATGEAFFRLVLPHYAAPAHIDLPARLMALKEPFLAAVRAHLHGARRTTTVEPRYSSV